MSKKENKFYIYCFLDPRKPGKYSYMENWIGIDLDYLPFYVGKGCHNRKKDHLREAKNNNFENLKCNKHKIRTIRKIWAEGLEPFIYILCDNLEEKISFKLEKFLILLFGRKDLKTGSLTNMTNGGEGVTNLSEEGINNLKKARTGTKQPEEVKNKISIALKGRSLEDLHGEQKANEIREKRKIRKRRKMTELERKLNSERQKGRKFSEEHIQKLKIAANNRAPVTEETRLKVKEGKALAKKRKLMNIQDFNRLGDH